MSVVAAPQSQMRYSLDARHVILNGTPLPDNILCSIFQFLAEERARYRGGYYKVVAIDVVPLVCQRWRAIATVKPRLWKTIVFHDHTSAISVQRKLSLSQQSRLKINIQQADPNNGNSLQDYVACARLLAKEAWHIQIFKIRGFKCAPLSKIT
ncbi:hypothetical protein FOMPIDRAFT_1019963 [Fomitopsis schrenkii]|uniref:F-box domain-containing protein n=1 Tax=Fomitopsis schrenkii TaxID=2126942 RepID=S8DM34_FOMSC|nr:hypothetical protein FOMPIDRAFT_1019963 [Fomitopsis schrenkii]